jgi:hypothetical protein
MGLPSIIIKFKTAAITAIQRGQRGVIALILKDSTNQGAKVLNSIKDIPGTLSADNKAYIERAFIGGIRVPRQVILFVLPAAADNYTDAYNYFETVKFNYLACPPDVTAGLAGTTATWIKNLYDNLDKKVKAVLPHIVADHESVINFDTDNIEVDSETYTAAEYCSRIAGILAGTPLTVSATFTVLPEVTNVPRLTKAEAGALIDAGKLILYHDGEKVKIARAVNSLTTVTVDKGKAFKKIKIVDILDLIHEDITTTANDNYIGKVPNDYDDKCILITAIQAYYEQLEKDKLLKKGSSSVGIDIEEQSLYLKSIGVDITKMSEYEIKSADTEDKVFLLSGLKPLDAIEDIKLNVNM